MYDGGGAEYYICPTLDILRRKEVFLMIIGKVTGSVVSTRKNEKLVGSKFMIVEPVCGADKTNKIVAVDNIGAGIGEYVLVALGSAARVGCGRENAPIDAAIVGIIDDGENFAK